MLNHRIDREHHIESVPGPHIRLAERNHLMMTPVGFGDAPAAHPCQFGIESQFDPILARGLHHPAAIKFAFLHANVAQHVCGQCLIGIYPQLVVERIGKNRLLAQVAIKHLFGSGQFLFVQTEGEGRHGGLELLPGFNRHMALEDNVTIGRDLAVFGAPERGLQPPEQIRFAELQQRGHRPGHFGLVFADEHRVGTNRFHKNACAQEVAFGVEDVAPAWLQEEFPLGVLLRFGAQVLVAQDLQIDQPIAQASKRHCQQAGQRQQPSILQCFAHVRNTGRPRRSVPHPTASRAAVKMSLIQFSPESFRGSTVRRIVALGPAWAGRAVARSTATPATVAAGPGADPVL